MMVELTCENCGWHITHELDFILLQCECGTVHGVVNFSKVIE